MTELFATDLYIPPYRHAEHGDWKLSSIPMGTGLGYWSSERGYIYQNAAILTNTGASGRTWMSMTPLEIESSEAGVRAAKGHSVIMGFGMGWTAAAMAMRPEVETVTVVEIDPDIPALFDLAVPAEARPAEWEKVEVVIADARTWRPAGGVDFLFADIWPRMGLAENLADVREMQSNIWAEELYYWGQELDLSNLAVELGWRPDPPPEEARDPNGAGEPLSEELAEAAWDALGLPVVMAEPAAERIEGAWREWRRRMVPTGGA